MNFKYYINIVILLKELKLLLVSYVSGKEILHEKSVSKSSNKRRDANLNDTDLAKFTEYVSSALCLTSRVA